MHRLERSKAGDSPYTGTLQSPRGVGAPLTFYGCIGPGRWGPFGCGRWAQPVDSPTTARCDHGVFWVSGQRLRAQYTRDRPWPGAASLWARVTPHTGDKDPETVTKGKRDPHCFQRSAHSKQQLLTPGFIFAALSGGEAPRGRTSPGAVAHTRLLTALTDPPETSSAARAAAVFRGAVCHGRPTQPLCYTAGFAPLALRGCCADPIGRLFLPSSAAVSATGGFVGSAPGVTIPSPPPHRP